MMKFCLAIAAVLAFGACKTVDNEDMAKKIKDSVNSNIETAGLNFKVKSVDCPSGKSMSEGTKFDCTGTMEDGKTGPIHVEIQKDQQFTADPSDFIKAEGE